MAQEAEASHNKSKWESRGWIYLSTSLAVLTAVMAFAAGFSGLNRWVGPDGVVALSFTSGILGVLAVFVNKAAETRGEPERMRSEALRNFGVEIRSLLVKYETYLDQLKADEPLEGFDKHILIIKWLSDEHQRLTSKRAALRKFTFTPATPPNTQPGPPKEHRLRHS
jgi:hypothetical protein